MIPILDQHEPSDIACLLGPIFANYFSSRRQQIERMKFSTPEQAETAFYSAFERADLRAMMDVWDATNDVVCVHPQGARLTGQIAVMSSWRAILANSVRLRFQVTERAQFAEGAIAVHIVHENIFLPRDVAVEAPIIATNVYRRGAEGWRMILHHASAAPVEAAKKQTPRGSLH
jgi:ketosteroid isomerase-like protein